MGKSFFVVAQLSALSILLLFVSCKSSNVVKESAFQPSAFDGEMPNGMPPGPPPDGGMPDQGVRKEITATIEVKQDSLLKQNAILQSSTENQSAVASFGKAQVKLIQNRISTSGNSSSMDQSSFYGLNAAVIGCDESVITMEKNMITATGTGANAIFAYGKSVVYSVGDTIDCTAQGAHGLMASGGGTIHASDVTMITRGANSGAIATDRGSGTITVERGKVTTTGADSPGLYSTGKLVASDAEITASGAEVAVIEGANSIELTNSTLLSTFPNKWGVMIYQSFSGDADGVDGVFKMNGGSLSYIDAKGPLFFVTNSNADIHLKNVQLQAPSGVLLKAVAYRWGHEGSNGGNANIWADSQTLTGDLMADKVSKINLSLANNSKLIGGVNSDNKADSVSFSMDNSSLWDVTKDSYVSHLQVSIVGDTVANISGNGHVVYYKKENNKSLENKTYALTNGGYLKPY